MLKLLVARLRQAWPKVEIIFRGDSGFCRWKLLKYCDQNDIGYVVGLVRNTVLEEMASPCTVLAHSRFLRTGQKQRDFSELRYAAKSWDRERRVILKADHLARGPNTRFVVTNLGDAPQAIYDAWHTPRGGTGHCRLWQVISRWSGRRPVLPGVTLPLHTASEVDMLSWVAGRIGIDRVCWRAVMCVCSLVKRASLTAGSMRFIRERIKRTSPGFSRCGQVKNEPVPVFGDEELTMRRARVAWTCLLVAGLLFVVLFVIPPALSKARQGERNRTCYGNMNTIGDALRQYHEVHGQFPESLDELADAGFISREILVCPERGAVLPGTGSSYHYVANSPMSSGTVLIHHARCSHFPNTADTGGWVFYGNGNLEYLDETEFRKTVGE